MSVLKATAGLLSRPFSAAHWDLLFMALGTALISGLAYAYYNSAGFILIHGDAISRLLIARRVFDSLDPGLVQLGGIWLPLPQMLMLPLVWIDPFWRTGLAGSIPSMAAFVGTSLYLYALGRRLTGHRLGGVVASLVFVSNPNMLYLQATPLSESLMLLTISAATYHLVVWLQQGDTPLHLMAAAFWVLLATLTRYEGWMLVLGGSIIVLAFTLTRHGDRRRAEALTLTFLVPAAYGVVLWLIYSAIIFGDPLYFASGFGTAKFDTQAAAASVQASAQWQVSGTLLTFGWSVVDMIGLPIVFIASVGFAILASKWALSLGRDQAVALGAVWFLSLPALLVMVTLFGGSAVIIGAHTPVQGLWNTRYGIEALPLVAVLVAYPVRLHRYVGILLVVAVLSYVAVTYQIGEPLTGDASVRQVKAENPADTGSLRAQAWGDANFPVPSALQPLVLLESLGSLDFKEAEIEASAWLRDHYAGELVLISAFANDPFMFSSGLGLETFVFEGAQPYWDDEMREPGTWTGWVVFQKKHYRDIVRMRLASQLEQSPRFVLEFENDSYEIFRVAYPVPWAGSLLLRDADCDGMVNSIDAFLILWVSQGLTRSLACSQNADVNGDGDVNELDARLVLQFDAGLVAR